MSARTNAVSLTIVAQVALGATGCLVFHPERDAPGHIDVHAPPERIEVERAEVPEDPGQRVTRLLLGPYLLTGPATRQGQSATLALQAGGELSLGFFELEQSHAPAVDPSLGMRDPGLYFPEGTIDQVNLGWSVVELLGSQQHLGPVYLEWQRTRARESPARSWGWMAGYSVSPHDGTHGPQLGALALSGLVFARASYQFGRGASVLVGFTHKLPLAFWVRSR